MNVCEHCGLSLDEEGRDINGKQYCPWPNPEQFHKPSE